MASGWASWIAWCNFGDIFKKGLNTKQFCLVQRYGFPGYVYTEPLIYRLAENVILLIHKLGSLIHYSYVTPLSIFILDNNRADVPCKSYYELHNHTGITMGANSRNKYILIFRIKSMPYVANWDSFTDSSAHILFWHEIVVLLRCSKSHATIYCIDCIYLVVFPLFWCCDSTIHWHSVLCI